MTILLIILAISLLWLFLSLILSKKEEKIEIIPEPKIVSIFSENPFFPPKAPEGMKVTFTILDVQTNGLISERGNIPDPIQISWLNLSSDFRAISHKTFLIQQEYLGDLFAHRVHKTDALQLAEYGKEEVEVSKKLLDILSSSSVLVFHNAEFDVQVLYQMLSRHYSEEVLHVLKQKKTVCTMRFEEHLYNQEYRYSRLTHLAHHLSGIPLPTLSDHPVISWRNVCLTRICLKRLCELHQVSDPLPQSLLTDLGTYLSVAY